MVDAAGPGGDAGESVVVVTHVRPLVDSEIEEGAAECLTVTGSAAEVGHGAHRFTYDRVFGGDAGDDPAALYGLCVAPLVDGLFKGYNATVFAYGQTGSGKTFTMGSAFPPDPRAAAAGHVGVIPRAMAALYARLADPPAGVEYAVRVGFVEIHREEVRDLLTPAGGGPRGLPGGVHVRELPGGGIVLAGAVEREAKTQAEMVAVLEEGSALRATAATGMNKTSSRSHAVFTVTLEQRRAAPAEGAAPPVARPKAPGGASSDSEGDEAAEINDEADAYLCAKMHLVDLAGSERAKRTRAQGARLAEGIKINRGLLALGNVINALVERKAHVPYRDSKLTRLLQDSLGGNSRTLMIACASPADVNLEESLNTLRYAARARAIKNRPVVNRDPVAAQLAALRGQLARARAENLALRRRLGLPAGGDEAAELAAELAAGGGGGAAAAAALEAAEARLAAAAAEGAALRAELATARDDARAATETAMTAALQRDRAARALRALGGEAAAAEALGAAPGEELDLARAQAARLAELEAELAELRRGGYGGGGGDFSAAAGSPRPPSPSLGGAGSPASVSALSPRGSDAAAAAAEAAEIDAAERAHRAELARVQAEMEVLQAQLEAKEAAVAAVAGHAAVRQSYEAALKEVGAERDALARERADLLARMAALRAAGAEERARLERGYKERLRELDARAKAAEKKERRVRELEAARARALDAARALERDIAAIKAQKVGLQRQAAEAAKGHAAWRRERDSEVAQLRKAGRAGAAALQRVEALAAKQAAVLLRKTEEAAAARRRLKQLEERRAGRGGATSSGRAPGEALARAGSAAGSELLDALAAEGAAAQPHAAAPVLRDEPARRGWVEAELDACTASHDLARVLEGEKALRAEAARQLREAERRLAALKNPGWWGPAAVRAGGAGGAAALGADALQRKRARLAEAVERHGAAIQEVSMALVRARAEEEERGGGAADARRWAGLGAPPPAAAMLVAVFRAAAGHRAAAYEAGAQAAELADEVETLRLRLEVAEAEKLEAQRAGAEAAADAAACAAAAPAASPAPPPRASPSPRPRADAADRRAADALRALEALDEGGEGGGEGEPAAAAGGASPPRRAPSPDEPAGSSGTPGSDGGSPGGSGGRRSPFGGRLKAAMLSLGRSPSGAGSGSPGKAPAPSPMRALAAAVMGSARVQAPPACSPLGAAAGGGPPPRHAPPAAAAPPAGTTADAMRRLALGEPAAAADGDDEDGYLVRPLPSARGGGPAASGGPAGSALSGGSVGSRGSAKGAPPRAARPVWVPSAK